MLHIGVQYSHAVADDDVTIGLGIEMVLFGSKIENRFRIALASCVCVCPPLLALFEWVLLKIYFVKQTERTTERVGRKGPRPGGAGPSVRIHCVAIILSIAVP